MTKKVKLPGDNDDREGLEDEEGVMDEASLDDVEAYGSEDVSDYEGQPKAAPRQAYFGADRCRIKFQLKSDPASGVIRVCGGTLGECSRKLHKQGTDRAPVGIYDTIITRACVDGVYGTYRSRPQQEAEDKALRLVLDEATKELVGSAAYQAQLRGLGTATTPSDGGDGFGGRQGPYEMQGTDGWALTSSESYEDTKIPATATKPRSDKRRPAAGTPDQDDMSALASKVNGIELALTKMASAVAQLAEDRAANRGVSWPDQSLSEGSSEDEVMRIPRGGDGVSGLGPKAKSKTPAPSRRYYAVARGRNPGVYKDWGDAERQVNGFSGALHKKFKSLREARTFVIRHGTKHAEPSEDEDDEAEYFNQMDSTGRTAAGMADTGGGSRGGMEARNEVGFPPLDIAAPDPSTGNAKELFKMALGSEEEMAAKLSPPGLDKRTMQELANATLDAIQLPGTSPAENLDGTGELVGALREMASDRQYEWAEDRPQKDSLWRTAGRTSILTVKTADALQERIGEFAGIPEEMFETQVHRFRAIFGKLHWSEAQIMAWSTNNWFLRIGKDTLDHYVALHLHLFTLSNTEGWTYAQEALKHYGAKLLQFRRTATSRLVCLLRIYIFLRDARRNDFHSAKLQEKRNHSMLAKIMALELSSGKGGPATHKCKKCGLDAHPGGVTKCWFRNLPDAEAKRRGAKLMTKLGKMSIDEINALVGGSTTADEE